MGIKNKKLFITLIVVGSIIAICVPVLILLLGANKYTVTYNLFGDTNSTIKITKGGTLEEPTDPNRTNYTFLGWFEDEDYEKEFTFPSVINANTTIYAKWRYASMINLENIYNNLTENEIFSIYSDDKMYIKNEIEIVVNDTNLKDILIVGTDMTYLIGATSLNTVQALYDELNEMFSSMADLSIEGNVVIVSFTKTTIEKHYLLGEIKTNDTYSYIEYDKKCYINGYLGTGLQVVIPSYINNAKVIGLSAYAFCDYIAETDPIVTKLTIPNTVKYIGNSALEGGDVLTEVIFESGSKLKVIETNAFRYCNALETINFPETISYVGTSAINGTEWLTSHSDGAIYLGKVLYTYKGDCPATFNIKNGTEIILGGSSDDSAFKNKDTLVTINFPKSVKTIFRNAFYGCSNLENVNLNEGLLNIEEKAFYGCNSIETITIPSTVLNIHSTTFCYSSGLTAINVNANNPIYRSTNGILFSGTKLLLYPRSKTNTSYTISNLITEIGNNAFYGANLLQSVGISSSVTIIGDNAFQGCGLQSITIPSSVVEVGDGVFSNCSSLASVTINNGLTKLGSSMFEYCPITTITIPSSVTEIGHHCFNNCTSLASVSFVSNNTLKAIDSRAFYACVNLATITSGTGDSLTSGFPLSVISTGESVFNLDASSFIPWYNNLSDGLVYIGGTANSYKGTMAPDTTLTFLDGTETIGGHAFANQTNLVAIKIPETVKLIQNTAFEYCTNLAIITFSGDSLLEEIGTYAFNNCTSLGGLVLPNSLKIINNRAFYNCTRMNGILIGQNIEEIGIKAFHNCGQDVDGILISISATTPPIMYTLFDLINYAETDVVRINVPNASLAAYLSAWSVYEDLIIGV